MAKTINRKTAHAIESCNVSTSTDTTPSSDASKAVAEGLSMDVDEPIEFDTNGMYECNAIEWQSSLNPYGSHHLESFYCDFQLLPNFESYASHCMDLYESGDSYEI